MNFRIALLAIILMCANTANAQWVEGGAIICDEPSDQTIAGIISDTEGGAIIIWKDDRDLFPMGHSKYFGQRIDSDGIPLWAANGIPVCDTANIHVSLFSIISDGAGGAILTWVHTPGFKEQNIYAQRISSNGYPLWTHDGVPVCTAYKQQIRPSCTSDGANGLIVTWEDSRDGLQDTYAQRIRANGTAAWTTNGIRVSFSSECERAQSLTSDGAGGAIIAWADRRDGNWDIYAQRVDPNGVLQWDLNCVPIYIGEGGQFYPILTSDGAHGAIIVWVDDIWDCDFYAQRVDSNGTVMWDPAGVPICTNEHDQGECILINDEAGGAYIIWEDPRNMNVDIYGQRIDADGNLLWQVDGKPLCLHSESQTCLGVTRDGSGGLILTWIDNRSGRNGIYAQRIDSEGNCCWDLDGIVITDDINNIAYSRITTDMEGGALIAYSGNYTDQSLDIFAKRLKSSGDIVATLLQEYMVDFADDGIRVRWKLSSIETDMMFVVYRSINNQKDYIRLQDLAIQNVGDLYYFIDRNVLSGCKYRYRISIIDDNSEIALFETDDIDTPEMSLVLYPNYPNPFNPSTTISFYIPIRCLVNIDIYNVDGNHVKRILSSDLDAGIYNIRWDGRDHAERSVSSGVYFCRLKTYRSNISQKIILLR